MKSIYSANDQQAWLAKNKGVNDTIVIVSDRNLYFNSYCATGYNEKNEPVAYKEGKNFEDTNLEVLIEMIGTLFQDELLILLEAISVKLEVKFFMHEGSLNILNMDYLKLALLVDGLGFVLRQRHVTKEVLQGERTAVYTIEARG